MKKYHIHERLNKRLLKIVTDNTYCGAHVRKFAYLSRKKSCLPQCLARATCLHTGLLLRQKKRLRIKIPTFHSGASTTKGQMSDESQPTDNHASFGGTFEVSDSSGEDTSIVEQKYDSEDAKSEHHRRPTKIPLNFRTWETVGKKTDSDETTFRFKVVSYNVLAQYLLEYHPYLYIDCSPRNLKWKHRSRRLYQEIRRLSPDILCLQEVQLSHLETFYSKFENIGYQGVFKQKTGDRQDGCAIYFKKSLFDLDDQISVEFFQPELPILNRDNIGVIVKLSPKELPGSSIVVATTHLLYNPKRTDVRLAQIKILLAEIDRFAYFNNGRESGHFPVILTGDFNSTPESAVIKLLDRGRVRASSLRDNSDWKRIGVTDNCQHLAVYLNRQQGCPPNFNKIKIHNSEYAFDSADADESDYWNDAHNRMFNSDVIGHSLNLISVYNKFKADGQMEASTFQDHWVTVDYIYFSSCRSGLRLLERLRLPTAAECGVLGTLPNEVYPSDHLATAAVFELRRFRYAS
uniref:Endonuclease/exonuclease/phosphatase domain-containing protein n=1 Tax=Bombyx mori TaxID=7091 RepID=A0A8R2QTM8_BOMMO|nr:protein angel homolog 2 isoform X4 [Bombyx mori]